MWSIDLMERTQRHTCMHISPSPYAEKTWTCTYRRDVQAGMCDRAWTGCVMRQKCEACRWSISQISWRNPATPIFVIFKFSRRITWLLSGLEKSSKSLIGMTEKKCSGQAERQVILLCWHSADTAPGFQLERWRMVAWNCWWYRVQKTGRSVRQCVRKRSESRIS